MSRQAAEDWIKEDLEKLNIKSLEDMNPYFELERVFYKCSVISEISSILHWDAAINMPLKACSLRGEQLAELEEITHEKLTNPRIFELIQEAESLSSDLSLWQAANLREIKKYYDNLVSTLIELNKKYTIASCKTEIIWGEAKAQNNFKLIEDSLTELLAIIREVSQHRAAYFGTTPYQSLLNIYDPGRKQEEIDSIFCQLEVFLPDFIQNIVANQPPNPNLSGDFAIETQKRLGISMMEIFGFDFGRGRLDVSNHPFCGGHFDDIRLTTRYRQHELFSALYGIIHETGHALYELNLPMEWSRQPVGNAGGMTMHESQSLFTGQQIGLSVPFFSFLSDKLKEFFPAQADFFSSLNIKNYLLQVRPSFIRVESDEVTYPLHIILRYNLEKKLIRGELEARHLEEAWNNEFLIKFGITPDSVSNGCLQDIHWPSGAFGYFPSYTLGAVVAAQLMDTIRENIPGIDNSIANGDFKDIYSWLKENIHSKGRLMNGTDMLKKATNEDLNVSYFIDYLKKKYSY